MIFVFVLPFKFEHEEQYFKILKTPNLCPVEKQKQDRTVKAPGTKLKGNPSLLYSCLQQTWSIDRGQYPSQENGLLVTATLKDVSEIERRHSNNSLCNLKGPPQFPCV